ncbi:YqaJ viral recombinase [uncultured Caudovirales phage]|uniref:YqaJ viral recombinase n=1 Tax=uncultured Caudovirales phage TaxID=2100421 RepID=A0A6J5LG25_9CAUD|nr:YqaJ viral recombinase [uncultured Caudovirales phage]
MKVLNLIQGSKEWLEHRAAAFNASDAPAMLGISKYKSRNDLIKERATGIVPEVNDATQRLFNDGHRFEALARPLAEEIIGEELSPITGTAEEYSASFDGITFDGSVIFEHKTMNANLRDALTNGLAPSEQYRAQMEHQLMVSGANKCLFMATAWDKDDKLVEEMHCWYMPDAVLRARIVAGWNQFEKDVSAYIPAEVKEAPKAESIKALPSVFVQATGMVTASNLAEFKEAANVFIANIKTELICDQDFADAESTVKFCKEAEMNLEATKSSVLAQMSTVDDVVRTLDHIAAQLRDKRLMLDKLVKSEKEARKLAIVSKAKEDFNTHLYALEEEIKPLRLQGQNPDFAGAIKGLKSLSSMQDKVDTALRDAKFSAEQLAKDIRAKLTWCKDSSTGFSFLFSDLSNLINNNGMEAFQAIVTSRIEKHKADEAVKLEAERKRLAAEMEAKLAKERALIQAHEEDKAKAEQDAIIAKAKAEERAKIEIEQRITPRVEVGTTAEIQPVSVRMESAAPVIRTAKEEIKHDVAFAPASNPTKESIIEVIAAHFELSIGDAEDAIIAAFF